MQYDEDLYSCIEAVIKNKNCTPYALNGIEDHIHIFADLHPSICLSDLIKEIKVVSSIQLKTRNKITRFSGWQNGYGAFTYLIRQKNTIIDYVNNQKEHHKKENYYDEYKRMLIENNIVFNEKYLF